MNGRTFDSATAYSFQIRNFSGKGRGWEWEWEGVSRNTTINVCPDIRYLIYDAVA
jgi:hypothetical protein